MTSEFVNSIKDPQAYWDKVDPVPSVDNTGLKSFDSLVKPSPFSKQTIQIPNSDTSRLLTPKFNEEKSPQLPNSESSLSSSRS